MILNIFFTPDEIRSFFEKNGFEVRQEETGRWEKQSHGSDKYITWNEDHVMLNGESVKASVLFERIAEIRLKKMILPSNSEIINVIKKQFYHISKCN